MHVRAPQDIDRYDPKFIYWEFQTDGIFCNSSQKDVYNQTVQDAVRRWVLLLQWLPGILILSRFACQFTND